MHFNGNFQMPLHYVDAKWISAECFVTKLVMQSGYEHCI